MRVTCLRYTRSKARTSPAAAAATSDASSSTASLSELLERSTDPASEIVPRGRPMCQSRWLVRPGRLHEETTRQPGTANRERRQPERRERREPGCHSERRPAGRLSSRAAARDLLSLTHGQPRVTQTRSLAAARDDSVAAGGS